MVFALVISTEIFKIRFASNYGNSCLTYRKECGGLERFVPASLGETMKRKELRKLLGHFIKINSNMNNPSGKEEEGGGVGNMTALQAKLHYLKIISDLPSYGAKCFSTTMSVSSCI